MKFKYVARTKTGELQTGFIESFDRNSATSTLTSHDLIVLTLESAETPKWYERFLALFKRVSTADLMVFTRQFATLLDAKISLGDSLKNLHRQTKNAALKEIVFDTSADVEAGLSLSQALERHPEVFPDFYVNMVRSAEITGRMSEVMVFLADYLEKSHTTTTKVRNAMIYPVVVIILLVGVMLVMVGFVFPKLIPVFEESNVQLPLITRVIFAVGTFISNWWWAVFLAFIAGGYFLVNYLRTKEGQIVLDEVLMKVPIFGNLLRKLYIARFAELTSVLIKGGTPIAQSLEIAGNTVGSYIYRDQIFEIAEAVRGGQLLSQALEERQVHFPTLVSQMVSVGESTGKLEELLSRVAGFYTREVDDLVNNLVELIQPLLMVVIGVAVGILFAAVLLPIFSLVQTF